MGFLDGATVAVIGGSSGIGLATAQAARAEGASVVITGRSADRLTDALGTFGDGEPAVRGVQLDSTDEQGTRALFEELPRVDHIFVSASTVLGGGLSRDTESLRPALDTRVWGCLFAAKYGGPRMSEGGSITFCSGSSSIRPRPGSALGAASCAAVESMARTLAIDLAPVRVNAVVPGLIDTPLLGGSGAERAQRLAEAGRALPVGRVGRPEDIADAVLFLMRNGFVTGISLIVDGGRVLGSGPLGAS